MDLFYGIRLEKLIFLACWIALAILGGALLAFGWEWLQRTPIFSPISILSMLIYVAAGT